MWPANYLIILAKMMFFAISFGLFLLLQNLGGSNLRCRRATYWGAIECRPYLEKHAHLLKEAWQMQCLSMGTRPTPGHLMGASHDMRKGTAG